MFLIKTFNKISPTGLAEFDAAHYQIDDNTDVPDALLVRSHDLHGAHFPDTLKVVGRAGAGTNNIPVDQLTQRGIPVLNTPGANANAVKELVLTGMLLACRNICPAWDYVRQLEGDDETLHQQVEQNKKRFAGFELPGKTLGVIGLGKIGVRVANMARHLEMRVIGYDPVMTVQSAWQLRSSVQRAEALEDTLTHSDFISIHVPLNEHTHHLINDDRLKKIKPGAILLNFARDAIVDDKAVLTALERKQLRAYVSDFPSQTLQGHPNVISLPHLGASTQEAEENCAVMIAQQVKDFLENGHIHNAVNFPSVKMPRTPDTYRIAIVNQNIPNMVAQISSTLSAKDENIIDMINKSKGEIAYTLLDVDQVVDADTTNALSAIEGIVRVRVISDH